MLLAEDDKELRGLLAAALSDFGFEVVAVQDGQAALDVVAAATHGEMTAPDLVVLDARMPRMGGLEVLRALRAAGNELPIVLMTGYPEPALAREVERLRASCLVDKPVEAEDLCEIVDLLLLRGRSRRFDA